MALSYSFIIINADDNNRMPRILFVSGFHPSTRARELAYEFER